MQKTESRLLALERQCRRPLTGIVVMKAGETFEEADARTGGDRPVVVVPEKQPMEDRKQ